MKYPEHTESQPLSGPVAKKIAAAVKKDKSLANRQAKATNRRILLANYGVQGKKRKKILAA